jgi:hypothetical protein
VLSHPTRTDLAIAWQRYMNAMLAPTRNWRGDKRNTDIDIAKVIGAKRVLLIQAQIEAILMKKSVPVPDLKPDHEPVNTVTKGRGLRGVFVVCHGITISTDH